MKKITCIVCLLLVLTTLGNSAIVFAEEPIIETIPSEAVASDTETGGNSITQPVSQSDNTLSVESMQITTAQQTEEEETVALVSLEEPIPASGEGELTSVPIPPETTITTFSDTDETETEEPPKPPQEEAPEDPTPPSLDEEPEKDPPILQTPEAPEMPETPPGDELPPPIIEDPIIPVFSLPVVKRITLDSKQDKEGYAKIHIAIKKEANDTRPFELIILPIEDANAQDAAAYLNSHPLASNAFRAENLLHVDSHDSKQRYKAAIPHGTRFIIVGRVEGQIFHSKIHPGFAAELPPEDPTDPEDIDEDTEPEGEEEGTSPGESDGQVYVTPKDEDRDGFYSRTEYRLGLNPNMRDTHGEGVGDFMSVYMQGRLGREGHNTLFSMDNTDASKSLIAAGLLDNPLTADNHGWALNKMKKNWTSGGPALIGHLDRTTTRMLCINNYGIFVGSFGASRQFQIENAMHLSVINYPAANKHRFARCFDATADGKIALLYDRVITEDSGKGGGALRANAMLIDATTMSAYPLEGTEGAKDVALSLDASLLAILRDDELSIWNLLTGEKVRITDKDELSRIEMLAFTEDNLLVVRVTQIGYTAVSEKGSMVLGGSNQLGVFVCGRDMLGFDVYDKDHLLLRVDAKLFLASNGIQVTGEDSKSYRLLSQDDLRRYIAGL